ncbi:2-isopropylmalate synthase/homocitrate synthase family protein [Beutenbergia cavernae DSM 12333]|uniref:Citramalate synthase n=1 Tax=Beutenbergia cavernae (strain ATCC BAA-8 / DSM 12333 / CCUG 43141 / JCM 11478 / NBRC 16432 / NCIMB 13614 / HKI 0122) TaxID=471853 RepID=C5C2J4_BEUC1|nr:citramalate synthase [Beutenbergia cavernae]ACQ79680.1 2-isopropylmalate synthase/homocitrate synthase family protein [Beutenbergia cavernae DSM 12333]
MTTLPALAGTAVQVYDTTLRDGAQQEGMNLTVADKLAIAPLLAELGVAIIEGGWPGAIPKDTEFFKRAEKELDLGDVELAAFGSTRKAGSRAHDDAQVRALLDSGAPVVTLVAKSDIRHVERALRTDGPENLAMIADTVRYLVGEGRRVIVDAEHFFDGYVFDADYALAAVAAAFEAGAETVTLCDTNGGMLPDGVHEIVAAVRARSGGRLGMHAHNDSGCAVANTLAAVAAGATHVQGTVNGYGERTGNADLVAVVANLELKLGATALTPGGLDDAMRISHAISEITNISPYARQPYVGASAFAHKAGLHASAIRVDPDLYQHADPTRVGNDMRMLVSDMAGRASIELKGRELGFDLAGQDDVLGRVTHRVKDAEAQGYTFDAADASFALLLREEVDGARPQFFTMESWRVSVHYLPRHSPDTDAEATVKLHAGGERIVATGEGNGPVNALDHALRRALLPAYPEIADFELIDFKVRLIDTSHGTDAVTRVLIETTDGQDVWSTVGIGPNILEASYEALSDSLVFGLLARGVEPR